ncbi:hypothetical protein RJ640_008389 [Escallonia rubra]|uniref:Uncharacterized protein n=1 Tax=Escallonia rubra TaxID=112253 RepID=A0AA88RCK3_9ASTE|nr:hypothetical protein RJ640_008389 [Escallonia rubra]
MVESCWGYFVLLTNLPMQFSKAHVSELSSVIFIVTSH